MTEKQMLEVDVDGGKLAVAQWPGDGPDLVLVHGISASHMAWGPVVKALPSGRFNIYAPDLRGRGASNHLPEPFGLARHVDDLCHLIDQHCSRPVAFAGHSLGAYIGASDAVPVAAIETAVRDEFTGKKARFVPQNLAAFHAGVELGRTTAAAV